MRFYKEEAVWMDSCRIDKTSSVKPFESINSVFDWYRDAVVCHVYLVDHLASESAKFHSPFQVPDLASLPELDITRASGS